MTDQTTTPPAASTPSPLELAEAKVATAKAGHEAAVKRVAAARAESERLEAQVSNTDVDSPGFTKLVADRGVALERVKELEKRERAAQQKIGEAEATAEPLRLEAAQAELAAHEVKVLAHTSSTLDLAEEKFSELLKANSAGQELIKQANALETKVRQLDGSLHRIGPASHWHSSPLGGLVGDPASIIAGLHEAVVSRRAQRRDEATAKHFASVQRSPAEVAADAAAQRELEMKKDVRAGRPVVSGAAAVVTK